MKKSVLNAVLLSYSLFSIQLWAYPLDGYPDTGIGRVEAARLANEGVIKSLIKQPPGALLSTAQVDIRLRDKPDFQLPPLDEELGAQIEALLGDNADRYGMAVLDLSDLDKPRYAEWRGNYRQNVGSVGKLLVALGFFQALKDTFPNDTDGSSRSALLKDTIVIADEFSQRDHHTIRVFDPQNQTLDRHVMQVGERANQWQYLDWMLSVSSNAAAAMNQRQAMLLRQFGAAFPISDQATEEFFKTTPRGKLTELYQRTFWEPVTRNGMDLHYIRQGSFFTRTGKRKVSGGGKSYATARTLMEYIVKMEKGQLVDDWSSTQIKRLLYMTENRIRYASAPVLKDAAVYFKSGSLYSCKAEEGFHCGKYAGNVVNYMSSVAIIEAPAAQRDLYYIVVVISNVLRQNSAYDHQDMAGKVHQMILDAHPPEPVTEPETIAEPASTPEATTL